MIELKLTLPAGIAFVSLHHSAYNSMYHVCVSGKRDNGRVETAIGVDISLANAAHFACERLTLKLVEPEYDPRHWVSKEPFPKTTTKDVATALGLDLSSLDKL